MSRSAYLCGFLATLSIATGLGGRQAAAGTVSVVADSDTFINSVHPNNNNGGSASIFTGTDDLGGVMRGLVRFGIPDGLIGGRATITGVQLRMTLEALGDGTAGTPATETLQAARQGWWEGNGVGSAPETLTVGQPCGGAMTGATWNQFDCVAGINWSTPGADVFPGTLTATTAGIAVGAPVIWDSATNAGLIGIVQLWTDSPVWNGGWRINSSTEGQTGAAQRFYARESGTGPTLTITYSCAYGLKDTGTACVSSAVAPASQPLALALLALLLGVGAWRGMEDRSNKRGLR